VRVEPAGDDRQVGMEDAPRAGQDLRAHGGLQRDARQAVAERAGPVVV